MEVEQPGPEKTAQDEPSSHDKTKEKDPTRETLFVDKLRADVTEAAVRAHFEAGLKDTTAVVREVRVKWRRIGAADTTLSLIHI